MLRILIFAILAVVSCHPPEIVYHWNKLDYNFPNESMREAYIASGDFVQATNLPLSVSVWRDKMFITVTRWKKGVPANLNYISMSENSDESPKLTPYPSWEANNIYSTASDVIIDIYRPKIDVCDRLWGLDAGIDDMFGSSKVMRPRRLIVIDLKTDQIIRVYTLKATDQKLKSIFPILAIDVEKDSCDDAYAYITDFSTHGMLVYSWAQNNSWRFEHSSFVNDPLQGDFNIRGLKLHYTHGIFGVVLSPLRPDGTKTVYYHALTSIKEYSVSTSVLKNESITRTDYSDLFKLEGERGEGSQATVSAIDPETGIIYFPQYNRHGIACWDSNVPLNPSTFHLIAQDEEYLEFITDMSIDPTGRKLYVMMSNIQKLIGKNLDDTNMNYVYSKSLDSTTSQCKA